MLPRTNVCRRIAEYSFCPVKHLPEEYSRSCNAQVMLFTAMMSSVLHVYGLFIPYLVHLFATLIITVRCLDQGSSKQTNFPVYFTFIQLS